MVKFLKGERYFDLACKGELAFYFKFVGWKDRLIDLIWNKCYTIGFQVIYVLSNVFNRVYRLIHN